MLTPPELICWNVVEEHLDEAEFLFEQFESALVSPLYTLDELAETIEERLLAHLDGLLIGSEAVAERLLYPELENENEPERAAVAALVLLETGRTEHWYEVFGALLYAEDEGQRAISRALALSEAPNLELAIKSEFESARSPREKALWLEVLAARYTDPGPPLKECFDPGYVPLDLPALRAAGHAGRRDVMFKIEQLLDHEDPEVRYEAIEAGLIVGSPAALAACRHLAAEKVEPSGKALLLLALLGTPEDHRIIHRQLEHDEIREAALFAAGHTGRIESADRCLPFLESDDEREAKLAAEALAAITGFDLMNDETFQASPAEEEKDDDDEDDDDDPFPFDLDDLEADLTLEPVEELPLPNIETIRESYGANRDTFSEKERYLAGELHRSDKMLKALRSAPMRRRRGIVSELVTRTMAKRHVKTDAFSWMQAQQLRSFSNMDGRDLYG